ncbi:hypothetical protein LPTSP3_g38600 (plasmid) [Leptospira kobayashii]|uniref:Lipoprotein n=1 Tax=Leptospira kobayashii TaxID=1917830 RepID=A0ABM7UP27_9LEPT|nr:hypothetical protein [Leptospira kobayashii]BDA80930.1 hypothetical protein LPTSP3_g38600 [Leptospira kobayashii]
MMQLFKYFSAISLLCLCTCKSTEKDPDDPLKNSKKLIKEGHSSLFMQGALPVKGTSIKFIPPGEEAEIFILGRRVGFAKEEFSKSWKRAAESVVIIKDGTKFSISLANDIDDKGNETIQLIQKELTQPGIYIMEESVAKSKGITGNSWQKGKQAHDDIIKESTTLRKEWDEWADEILKEDSTPVEKNSDISKRMTGYKNTFKGTFSSFVQGYVDIDDSFKSAWDESFTEVSGGGWKSAFSDVNEVRSKVSKQVKKAWTETVFSYGKDTKEGLRDASKDIESIADGEGFSFSLLKAFAKTTKALFYDGIIEPVGKIGVLSIGYIGINGVVYPATVATVTAGTGVYFLAETFTIAGKGIVYIVAPNLKLALGALLGSTEFVTYESYHSLKAGGQTSARLIKKSSGYSLKGAAIVTEKSGKYILAPASLMGVSASQALVGGGVAVGGVTAGGVVTTSSFAVQTATFATTKTAAIATGTTGTIASLGVGGSYGIYQVTKAVGVPTGVALGSGVVMSYEMTAQLSAHSILAVSDCSYLVLSMEGGKWIVYGVKDVTNKANGLLVGAVVDLDQAKKEGNVIVKVPLEKDEADKIFEPKKKK